MRRAFVIASTYSRHPRLAEIPSSSGRLLTDRLNELDTGFDAVKLGITSKLEGQLADALEGGDDGGSLLVYISGYVDVEGDAAALLLATRRGGKLGFDRLSRLLSNSASRVAVVVDVAHRAGADEIGQSVTVLSAIRDAVCSEGSNIQLLASARPADATVSSGPSLFTRLFLLALERASDGNRDRRVTLAELYEAMRADEERFHELPATGFFGHVGDLEMTVGGRRVAGSLGAPAPEPDVESRPESAPPSSAPLSSRAPPKPASSRSGQHRAVVPPTVESLVASGNLNRDQGQFDLAVADYKKALLLAGGKPAKLGIYVAMGHAKLGAGKEVEAIHNYDKALAIEPMHREAFSAVADLVRRAGDYARLDRLYRRRLEVVGDVDRRFDVLIDIAQLWFDEAHDSRRGAEVLDEALALRPDDTAALERYVWVQEELGRFAAAVATRRRLADAYDDDAASKARVLTAAAKAVLDHLPNKEDAIDLAKGALAADPSALEALELVASLLGKRKRWIDLAETYESVLERTPEPEVGFQLAKSLGMLYRDRLDDIEGASRTFERAVFLNPADVETRYWLSELHQVTGNLDKATAQFQRAAEHAPRVADVHRRALWLFELEKRVDAAWRASAVLDFLGEADINESLVADQHRPEGPLAATATLTEDDWQSGALWRGRDAAVATIFEAVSTAAAAVKVEAARAGLPTIGPETRQDLDSSTATLTRSLTWAARLIGVAPPELHLVPDAEAPIRALPSKVPTTVVSKALAQGLAVPELAFLWSRHLTLQRPEHSLLVFYPAVRDVAVVFVAALAAGGSESSAPESLGTEAATLSAELGRRLDDEQRAKLDALVERFDPSKAKRRVVQWRGSVHRAAARAGLLACGDLAIAAKMIEQFPGELEPAAELDDLLAFAISDEYGDLRRRIGVEIV